MSTTGESVEIRETLVRALGWEDGHVGFETAVAGLLPEHRATIPAGLPYSIWQVAEHIRLTQRDILEFCYDPEYQERHWPDDYWPQSADPPDESTWQATCTAVADDRNALARLVRDSARSLVAPIPHGDGQTLLREAVLVIDHTAYHVGQIVLLRKALGAWGT
jgi:hypothetical protein